MADNVSNVTDSTFQAEVIEASKTQPVMVDFWAEWCRPCLMLAPTVAEVATAYAGKIKVVKLNVDENTNSAGQFNIRGIPTLLIFKGGQVAEQVVGAVPRDQIEKAVQRHLVVSSPCQIELAPGRCNRPGAGAIGRKATLMVRYHDEEWGVPVHDDRVLFEFLILEGAQAGLSWETVLRKRERYREVFDGFDASQNRAIRRSKSARAARRSRHHSKSPENFLHHFQCAGVSRSAARIRQLRRLHLAIHRRENAAARAARSERRARANRGIRRHEQGSEEARLPFCRLNDLLRVHAGYRHGERSSSHLLPLGGNWLRIAAHVAQASACGFSVLRKARCLTDATKTAQAEGLLPLMMPRNRLFCEKAQRARGVKSEQSPLRRRDAFQFQKREARFFEFRDFRAGVQDVADHQVQMRFVAEAKHDFGFHRLQFAQQIGRSAGALQGVRADDFLGRIADRFAKNFGGLHGSQPRAGQHSVRLHVQSAQAERRGVRALHSFGSERALGVGRAIGIFAVHGDAMADQIKMHH